MQPCLVCGNSFVAAQKNSIYCSSKCSKKAWKIKNRDHYLQQAREYVRRKRKKIREESKPIILSCLVCNSSFERSIYHPEQRCCSVNCSSKLWRREHPERARELKLQGDKRHRARIGAYNARYKDQLRFSGNRLRALRRDEFTCQNCFYIAPEQTNDRSQDVVVHHLDFSGQSPKPNNRIENLQTLCRPCHIRLHTHKVVHNR